ncbi:MAG TPA: hypothetical protein PK364_12080 [Synergistaceae bacterium]|nr:hypothetical protein [Synergistaceae bacterium]
MPDHKSQFRKAVVACSDVTLQEGLQALSPASREKIRPKNTRSVKGSVDLDKDLRDRLPAENRWDYVVGYEGNDNVERAFFIEVHPAETSEIRRMVRKAQSLKTWAERHAPDLWNMTIPREIHWVASGRCNLRLNDAYRRQLALAGVGSPKQYLELT